MTGLRSWVLLSLTGTEPVSASTARELAATRSCGGGRNGLEPSIDFALELSCRRPPAEIPILIPKVSLDAGGPDGSKEPTVAGPEPVPMSDVREVAEILELLADSVIVNREFRSEERRGGKEGRRRASP